MFDDLAPRMADDWHVVALDARGCGDSDWSREGYSAQSFASDVGTVRAGDGALPVRLLRTLAGFAHRDAAGRVLRTPH